MLQSGKRESCRKPVIMEKQLAGRQEARSMIGQSSLSLNLPGIGVRGRDGRIHQGYPLQVF